MMGEASAAASGAARASAMADAARFTVWQGWPGELQRSSDSVIEVLAF